MESRYTTKYTTYIGLIEFINHILYSHVGSTLFYTLACIKEKIKIYSYLTLMVIVQHMYLHPRSLRLCIWILNLHWPQGIQSLQKMQLRNRFTFGIIHLNGEWISNACFYAWRGPMWTIVDAYGLMCWVQTTYNHKHPQFIWGMKHEGL